MKFCCLGANGQMYNVTINASPNTTAYTVGDLLTLTCIVDPPIVSTTINVTYSWQCGGCFADDRTDMAVIETLTDMDTSMINCSATVDGVVFTTDIPFNLQVTQGRLYLQHEYRKGVGSFALPTDISTAHIYMQP